MDHKMSDQLHKLNKLLEFLRKTCKLRNAEMAHDHWFEILSCDGAGEGVLVYHFLFYFLYSRVAPEHLLIERLIPVLMSEEVSVDWILSIHQNSLETKLGFKGNCCAKMMKQLARDLEHGHGGNIPTNYDDLVNLWGVTDRVATLYLNYAEERSKVSFLFVCLIFFWNRILTKTLSSCNSIYQLTNM